MTQFFAQKIGGSELADLLADFACERSGLPRSAIKKIELIRNVYAADSLDQTLVVIFMEELEVDGGQKQ